MSGRFRETILNVVLIILSISLVLFGLEAGLWLGVLEPTKAERTWCDERKEPLQFHPEYGWTHPSDTRWFERRDATLSDPWYYMESNRKGFRDTYNSGAESVVVLGDSFTFGHLADDNATYSYLLDRWSPDVAFRNYGMTSYGTAQEYLVYRNVADQYEHDLVVLGYYFGNDMRENVRQRPADPKFALENGSLVQTHTPARELVRSDDSGGLLALPQVDAFQDFLQDHTRTYPFLAPKIRAVLGEAGVVESLPRPEPPTGEELTRQRRLTRALLAAIAEEAKSRDAEVLVLGIPARGDVDPDNPSHFRPEDAEPFWETQREMLANLERNHSNVHVLELKSSFQQEHRNGTQVYGKRDSHLTEQGHRVVARIVHRWSAEQGYVTRQTDSVYERQYDHDANSCPS